MRRVRRLVVVRAPLVSGFLWPLFAIAGAIVTVLGFWLWAIRWIAGDPLETGIRNYGPVGWALLSPVCLLYMVFGCWAVLDLLRASGIVAMVYARQVGDDLLVGPLGWVLAGQGARLRPGDALSITSSRTPGRRPGWGRYGWVDRWSIHCGESRFTFYAPLRVTAHHRAQAKQRLEVIRTMLGDLPHPDSR